MNKSIYHYLLISIALALSSASGLAQFYQGTNMEFGKNRVQYKDFTWFYYPSQHFEVYYYIGGEALAQYTLISAETSLPELEKFFDHALEDKVQIITYLKQSEFRQSNIGLGIGDQFNIGGSASIIGNKMFVYYEEDHAKFDYQLRVNLTRVLYKEMLYGGDWKDVLKSSTLLSLPAWFEEGVIHFVAGGGASEESINYVKDIALSGNFKSFNYLEDKEAILCGQAFWNYIAEVYGEAVISNVLYMTHASRSPDSGFMYILGVSLETLTNDFIQFYRQKALASQAKLLPGEVPSPTTDLKKDWRTWKKANKKMGDLQVKHKKKYTYDEFLSSPDGEKIAYVTHEKGQYRIWIYDTQTLKTRCILKREYKLDRLSDDSYPVLAWHPDSEILTYAIEKKDEVWMGNYNLTDKKRIEKRLLRIEKIISLQYSPDGKRMTFSGVNRGHTDIYLYQVIGNNFEQLTNDIWDDMQPAFIDGGKRIIFASNRPDDTLRTKYEVDKYPTNKDIYIYSLEPRSKYLERITQTPSIDEQQPLEYKDKHYTYLSNNYGTYNRIIANVDSTISAIDTTIHYRYFTVAQQLSNFPRSVKSHQYYPATKNYILHFEKDGKPLVYLGLPADEARGSIVPENNTPGENKIRPTVSTLKLSTDSIAKGNVDVYNYEFEDEKKNYTYEKQTIKVTTGAGETAQAPDETTKPKIELPRSRNYRLNFAADKIVTQLNNTFFAPVYQNFTGPSSSVPGLSGLTQIGISDLFEDYKVVGGFRFSLDLTSLEYGISVENLKGRWDKKMQFVRQVQRELFGFDVFKIHMNNFSYTLKYPFNELSSFRIRTDARYDRIVHQSNDIVSLSNPNQNELNVGVKLEYVFDNTSNKGLNLYNGTRYKVWAERYQQPNGDFIRTDLNVLGFDFRHYQKIHRSFIAAFRIAGATSFGSGKIMHYLGGVDNWLGQRIDNSTPIDYQNPAYRFQSFIGPVRGFYVNARNGNSAAVANAELRMPVFKYFMRRPLKSDFLENFQVLTFLDSGTAWSGNSPYGDDNLFNQTTISQQPVTVTVMNNREPIVYGYGFGLRSRILGYFVRADWAWGVDDGMILDRVFYLSLNLDF